jgi:hypothetical protein
MEGPSVIEIESSSSKNKMMRRVAKPSRPQCRSRISCCGTDEQLFRDIHLENDGIHKTVLTYSTSELFP